MRQQRERCDNRPLVLPRSLGETVAGRAPKDELLAVRETVCEINLKKGADRIEPRVLDVAALKLHKAMFDRQDARPIETPHFKPS